VEGQSGWEVYEAISLVPCTRGQAGMFREGEDGSEPAAPSRNRNSERRCLGRLPLILEVFSSLNDSVIPLGLETRAEPRAEPQHG